MAENYKQISPICRNVLSLCHFFHFPPMPNLLVLAILAAIVYFIVKSRKAAAPSNPNSQPSQRQPGGISKAEAHARGDAFEDYVDRMIFGKSFALRYRTKNLAETQGKYDASVKQPDFRYFCHQYRKEFWVEAKFRESTMDRKVEWCRYDQLLRYRRENEKMIVFIAIGLGGTPEWPKRLFIVPLDALNYTGVYLSILEPYEVHTGRALTSAGLWRQAGGR